MPVSVDLQQIQIHYAQYIIACIQSKVNNIFFFFHTLSHFIFTRVNEKKYTQSYNKESSVVTAFKWSTTVEYILFSN